MTESTIPTIPLDSNSQGTSRLVNTLISQEGDVPGEGIEAPFPAPYLAYALLPLSISEL
jgi:hypothetical protein